MMPHKKKDKKQVKSNSKKRKLPKRNERAKKHLKKKGKK
jgi:hypothetical protein